MAQTRAGLSFVVALATALYGATVPAGNSDPAPTRYPIAFTTSVTGTADLSTWSDAGGQTGTAAADAICQARATAAGLANPQNFVAWLSTSTDDAYCRARQATGKKAVCESDPNNPDAGPWQRTDGVLAAGVLDDMVSDHVYVPLIVDEFANDIAGFPAAWIATQPPGVLQGTTCDDWSDAAGGSARLVSVFNTTWTTTGSGDCALERHLICLESGRSAPPPELPPPADKRIAFITSSPGNGELGSWPQVDGGAAGMAAGDSICNTFAQDASLPHAGSYKAWLSDGTTDARDRFVNDGPIHRVDGFRVAYSMADLTKGTIETTIHQSQAGDYLRNRAVWTGTMADGTAADDHCAGWTTTEAQGRRGTSYSTTQNWTQGPISVCASTNGYLYCIADVPVDNFFDDGLETGNF
ncbi:hypothetical protein [Elongatibacter sediminis]|uniref:DUF1554 domain-containing protein n=1 Tax=Elongatibacter sediminis TaxID=3119006 RepID=A0AAW9RI60_9GAMM